MRGFCVRSLSLVSVLVILSCIARVAFGQVLWDNFRGDYISGGASPVVTFKLPVIKAKGDLYDTSSVTNDSLEFITYGVFFIPTGYGINGVEAVTERVVTEGLCNDAPSLEKALERQELLWSYGVKIVLPPSRYPSGGYQVEIRPLQPGIKVAKQFLNIEFKGAPYGSLVNFGEIYAYSGYRNPLAVLYLGRRDSTNEGIGIVDPYDSHLYWGTGFAVWHALKAFIGAQGGDNSPRALNQGTYFDLLPKHNGDWHKPYGFVTEHLLVQTIPKDFFGIPFYMRITADPVSVIEIRFGPAVVLP